MTILRIDKVPGCFLCIVTLLQPITLSADDFKVAVLQFGTVSWEMDVIKHHKLDKKYNFNLDVIELGSANAINIRLQSKDVDAVVGDWIWVSRQRDMGKQYTAFPYSLSAGEVIVDPESNINSIADFSGNKIGIAGGPTNKNWLIYQAFAEKKYGSHFNKSVQTAFAAPPLLNKLFLKGDFIAAINFWHYAARLKGAGMTKLLSIKDMLKELDVAESIPLLVWIFSNVSKSDNTINQFLSASFEAKNILNNVDEEWVRIKNIMRVKDNEELKILRDHYRATIPKRFGQSEINSSKRLYKILMQYGNSDFNNGSKELNEGTFYTNYSIL